MARSGARATVEVMDTATQSPAPSRPRSPLGGERLRKLRVVATAGLFGGGVGYALAYALGACSTCAMGRTPLSFMLVTGGVAAYAALTALREG